MDWPIILFAYNRPEHLRRTLACLRENRVPLIYAFSDGPKSPEGVGPIAEVRQTLRAIDWCETILCERTENLGLGRSVLAGVTSVLAKHPGALVFEDDLVCVPGTYDYLKAALERYQDAPKVMSVTGWTHPSVTPNVGQEPYFDGRAECWVWGTWARAWGGMEVAARDLRRQCEAAGIDPFRYGADLPAMAEVELTKNIWAVRWLYLHLRRGGLCLRPPQSLVEHMGFDALATNASDGRQWSGQPLRPCPPIPAQWPEPVEHPNCARLWQQAYGGRPAWWRQAGRKVKKLWRARGA